MTDFVKLELEHGVYRPRGSGHERLEESQSTTRTQAEAPGHASPEVCLKRAAEHQHLGDDSVPEAGARQTRSAKDQCVILDDV